MNCSIIIPFHNEEDCASEVIAEVRQACPDAEIIAVDDGSTDRTAAQLEAFPGIRLLRFPKNLGQSAALYAGLQAATRETCVMMDGDGQNDPSDIPALIRALDTGRGDLICGYRAKRMDSWSKRVASRIANRIRDALLHDGVRDTGCTLKAMRREHVRFLVPFNGLHRFIPCLLVHSGLKIHQIPVNHRPRLKGVSKYTMGGRAARGLYDLIGVAWLLKRQIRWHKGQPGLVWPDV
jgi:dolichol-phosphate mannosyltransferase